MAQQILRNSAVCSLVRPNSRAMVSVAPAATVQQNRPLKEMPGPTNKLGQLWWGFKNRSRMHDAQLEQESKYGRMWQSSFGFNPNVNVAHVALAEQLMRQEGKYPKRIEVNFMQQYRDLRGYSYGLLNHNGPEWRHLRTAVSKRIMRPKEVPRYGDSMNEVVTDMIARFKDLRDTTGGGKTVPDLTNELYKWAMESIATVLFDTRLGCLEREMPEKTQQFIDSIATMFKTAFLVSALKPWMLTYLGLGVWKRHVEAWDVIFSVAHENIDRKVLDIDARLSRGEDLDGSFLTYMLTGTDVTKKDLYATVTELLLAGVDTTSNTMVWTLYELARHPELQERLHQEVSSVVSPGQIPTVDDVKNMALLKNVIKEILRVYPVLPANGRVLDKDIVLDGYNIPKGTQFAILHYNMTRDPEVFEEPDKFNPDRWTRMGTEKVNTFSSVPFGFGPRQCAGRRLAEMEMYLVLARLVQTFEVRQLTPGEVVRPVTRALLVPGDPVHLEFIDRP
ncbi:sterol 26-hydroxylase, mitochondrial-like [Branchiostoma floridae x Branchiostoma japonicum]